MTFKLKTDSSNRFNKFIQDILENGKIFYMLHPEGGVFLCTSNEFFDENQMPAPVIAVWSLTYLAYAKRYANELEIKEIHFEEFYQQMLPVMTQDGLILGVNWDQNGFGSEIIASDMYEKISRSIV